MPKLAYIGPSKEIVLHEDVPCSAVVDLVVFYDLTNIFLVNDMVKNDLNAPLAVNQQEIATPFLAVAKVFLSVLPRISTFSTFIHFRAFSALRLFPLDVNDFISTLAQLFALD